MVPTISSSQARLWIPGQLEVSPNYPLSQDVGAQGSAAAYGELCFISWGDTRRPVGTLEEDTQEAVQQ